MVDDNYKGAETDKEAISDWGGGGRGWEKAKQIFEHSEPRVTKEPCEPLKNWCRTRASEIYIRARQKAPPPHPSISWIN